MNEPKGKLCLQVVVLTADTDTSGDIFDGWLLSQIDTEWGIFIFVKVDKEGKPIKTSN